MKKYLKCAEWSSELLQEKRCPKKVWLETEEMIRRKEW